MAEKLCYKFSTLATLEMDKSTYTKCVSTLDRHEIFRGFNLILDTRRDLGLGHTGIVVAECATADGAVLLQSVVIPWHKLIHHRVTASRPCG